MGMSEFYGKADEQESVATLHRAVELGITLLDTADIYGYGENERLVGRAIKGIRDRVVVAIKFGIVRKKEDPAFRGICGRPEYVRQSCEASLKRLGIDVIDLYYIHRVDAAIPIEELAQIDAACPRGGSLRRPLPGHELRQHRVAAAMMVPGGIQFIKHVIGLFEEQDLLS